MLDAGGQGRVCCAMVARRSLGARTLVPLGRAHREGLLRAAFDPAVRAATLGKDEQPNVWVDNVLRAARRGRRSGDRYDFAVRDDGAAFIGVVSVQIHGAGVANLSYWIDAAHRRRRHATAAARHAARFAFEVLEVRSLVAHVRAKNRSSQRVVRRLGFRRAGGPGDYVLAPADLSLPSHREGETMLRIRQLQHEALQVGVDRRFAQAVIDRLSATFPESFPPTTLAHLEGGALSALQRARAYDLRADRDLIAFVELALMISPRFHEHPAFEPALRDPRIAAEQRMTELLAVLSPEVWDEASRL
jgi:RimJ/RimL family protein N-acetyltransferase